MNNNKDWEECLNILKNTKSVNDCMFNYMFEYYKLLYKEKKYTTYTISDLQDFKYYINRFISIPLANKIGITTIPSYADINFFLQPTINYYNNLYKSS